MGSARWSQRSSPHSWSRILVRRLNKPLNISVVVCECSSDSVTVDNKAINDKAPATGKQPNRHHSDHNGKPGNRASKTIRGTVNRAGRWSNSRLLDHNETPGTQSCQLGEPLTCDVGHMCHEIGLVWFRWDRFGANVCVGNHDGAAAGRRHPGIFASTLSRGGSRTDRAVSRCPKATTAAGLQDLARSSPRSPLR